MRIVVSGTVNELGLFLAWDDAKLMGLQNCYLGFSKLKKCDLSWKKSIFPIFLTQKMCSIPTFSKWAPVANFSLLSQKTAKLFGFSFISIPVTYIRYITKIKIHGFACSKNCTRKQWHHWIPELKLHLIDIFLINFGHI